MTGFVIRPIEERDFDDLKSLAASIEGGLTSLPNDEEFLRNKIYDSQKAFHPRIRKPGGECYLFVLEDVARQKVVGTSGIVSKVGGFEPFYSYTIKSENHTYEPLKISKNVQVLHLTKNYNGPSEICSLFLSKEYRNMGLARLLSLSRFLFMAEYPKRFDSVVISELRGVIDDQRVAPFWECVGRHFFDYDFYTCDFLSGMGNKEFIASLMPGHPIYIPLLPKAVQDVIGQVHRETRPAYSLLIKEGFHFNQEVDIFDAGPIISCKFKEIRTLKESMVSEISEVVPSMELETKYLVTNGKLDFRAMIAPVKPLESGKAALEKATADLLGLKPGDSLRYSALRS